MSVPTYAAAAPPVTASLGCSKCGASLPDEAQFCLKCGKPVSLPAKSVSGVPGVEVLPPQLPRPKPKRSRGLLFFLLVMLLLGVVVLVATSDHPVAQEIQEMVGWKHDQVILDTPFTVGPHTFRYYKFSLPEGSVNVAIMGQFAAESPNSGAHKKDKEKDKDKDKDVDKDKEKENDGGIEVFVLTDEAFTVWQNGYATSSVYESGKVPTGTVQADLPAGAGVYYLVFSNKLSPKTPKNVQSTVLLRYKSWLPESFRKMKERFMNWTGL